MPGEDLLPPCSAVWVAMLAQTKRFFLLETKVAVQCQMESTLVSAGGSEHRLLGLPWSSGCMQLLALLPPRSLPQHLAQASELPWFPL